MAFYGLTSYDRCVKLLEIFKQKGVKELSQEELAKQIAINIGSSKFYKTIKNYISMMVAFKMIEFKEGKYIINYEVLND